MTEATGAGPEDAARGVPLTVLGVRVELPEQQHVILLLDPPGTTVLPLWVGAPEAAAAALALDGMATPRPLTHDLLLSVVDALGGSLERVRLTEVRDDVVHARLELAGGGVVDARASDAVALALRAEVPVLCSPDLLREAGMATGKGEGAEEQRQVDDFRDFLDSVDPDDFA